MQALFRKTEDLEKREVALLAAGTDTPEAETKAWYETAPTYVIDPIILAIRRISKMDDEEAQKSGGDSDRPGGG